MGGGTVMFVPECEPEFSSCIILLCSECFAEETSVAFSSWGQSDYTQRVYMLSWLFITAVSLQERFQELSFPISFSTENL